MANLPALLGTVLLAAEETNELFPLYFWRGVIAAVLYGLLGLGLVLLGFKLFDWITPRMNIEKELAEKNNIAVAIVVGSIIIGVCYLVASVVH